jgi:hypothetical protein
MPPPAQGDDSPWIFNGVILCSGCNSKFHESGLPSSPPPKKTDSSSEDIVDCKMCHAKGVGAQQWRSAYPPGEEASPSMGMCVHCATVWDKATDAAGVWGGYFMGVMEMGEASIKSHGPSEYKLPMTAFLRVPIGGKDVGSLLTASSGSGNSLVENIRVQHAINFDSHTPCAALATTVKKVG